MYDGWSAEDDSEFRYPDRKFAPEGTIKVNLAEPFVQLARFCDSEFLHAGLERVGCHEIVRDTVAHEVLHARQYHVLPVRAVTSVPGACPEGLCDPRLIASTKRKIGYERQAWVFGEQFRTPQGTVAFGTALLRVKKEHPELFSDGGPYRLISDMGYQGTLKQAQEELASRDFSAGAKRFYEGEYRLPEIAWDMHRLAQALEGMQIDRFAARRRYEAISRAWSKAADKALRDELGRAFPCYLSVVARYERDKLIAGGLVR
jgi:hypothetical protein